MGTRIRAAGLVVLILLTFATSALQLTPTSLIDEEAKAWIAGTVIALVLILFFGLPYWEKFRAAAGKLSDPVVAAHDQSANAHAKQFADLHLAISILDGTVKDLQRQIDGNESHRRESMQAVQDQIQTAIRLLSD